MFMQKQKYNQPSGFMRKFPAGENIGFLRKLGSMPRSGMVLQPYPQPGKSPARPLERL